MTDNDKPGQKNQSVQRALKILRYLAERQQPAGVREVARHFGYSPSIAQRLLSTMADEGFVEQTGEASRYVVGHGAFQVGSSFLRKNDLLSAAMPQLQYLSDRNVTGFLGILRNDYVVYMGAIQGNGPIAVKSEIGTSTRPYTTALGKVLLADLPPSDIRKILSEPLKKVTDKSITSIDVLLEQLAEVRRLGYALNDCENRPGVYSVGAAVRDSSNAVVAAISGAVAVGTLDEGGKANLIELVVEAGRRASQKLGASPIGYR
ncbi:IclR family transcriptional regulator [Mesorhizobium sp. A556]